MKGAVPSRDSSLHMASSFVMETIKFAPDRLCERAHLIHAANFTYYCLRFSRWYLLQKNHFALCKKGNRFNLDLSEQ